jgi:hypothetical protein
MAAITWWGYSWGYGVSKPGVFPEKKATGAMALTDTEIKRD